MNKAVLRPLMNEMTDIGLQNGDFNLFCSHSLTHSLASLLDRCRILGCLYDQCHEKWGTGSDNAGSYRSSAASTVVSTRQLFLQAGEMKFCHREYEPDIRTPFSEQEHTLEASILFAMYLWSFPNLRTSTAR